MAKRMKVYTFHSWFNLDGRYVFRPFTFVAICYSADHKQNCEAWNEFTNPRESRLNKMAEGKEHNISRLPGGFPVFHIFYGHSKGNGNVYIMIELRASLNPGLRSSE